MNGLKIDMLNLWYGRFHALKDIALPMLKAGEIAGVIGPNAAGKSTFLHALAWPKNAAYEISYNGRDLAGFSHAERARIFGMMTQTPPQPSSLTPYELLASLVRALHLSQSNSALEQKIEQLFDTFDLMGDGFKPLNALSGGKRQLVGAVMLLLRQPEICLLDEPTSALDLHWRLILLDELQKYVRHENKIAIAALHDLNLASQYCDQVILINKGRLVAAGPPVEVLTEENISSVFHVEARLFTGSDNKLQIEIIRPLKQQTRENEKEAKAC